MRSRTVRDAAPTSVSCGVPWGLSFAFADWMYDGSCIAKDMSPFTVTLNSILRSEVKLKCNNDAKMRWNRLSLPSKAACNTFTNLPQLSEIPLVCTEESPIDDSVYLTSAAGRCTEVVTALSALVAEFCTDGNNAESNDGCVAITKGCLDI